MDNGKQQPAENKTRNDYAFLGAGVALGVALGAAMGNIALGLIAGILIGGLGSIWKKVR